MLDHVFLSVSDITRSIRFYEAALAPLGINARLDYDGKDGPPGHPDLKGFGANGRMFFWLREGIVEGRAVHVGFVPKASMKWKPPMLLPWMKVRSTTARLGRACTMTPTTTPPTC